MSPSPPSPGLLRTHGARATEEVLFDLLGEATVVDGDPAARAAALARSVRVVVPSTSLRHHVSAELVRRHGAVAGVQVQSLYAVAREILERGGPGAEGESPGRDRPGDLPFEILVRRLARQETALARGLDFLVDGYGAVAATVRDLLDAGLEPIHADAAEEALEATLGDESRVYSTRAEVDRARALVRVAARVGAGLGSLGVVRHSALFARAADRLAADPERALPARRVLIHGFADATGLATDLLVALVRHRGARLLLDAPPDPAAAGAGSGDSGAEAALLPPRWQEAFSARLGERLAGSAGDAEAEPLEGPPPAPAVDLFAAPGGEAEAREVALRVRALVEGPEQVAPETIGIVARELEPVRLALRGHLTTLGVPFSGLDARGSLTAAGRRARALLDLLRKGPELAADRWLDATASLRREDPAGHRRHAGPFVDLRLAFYATGTGSLRDVAELDVDALLGDRDGLPLPVRKGFSYGDGDDSGNDGGGDDATSSRGRGSFARRRYVPRAVLTGAVTVAGEVLARLRDWPDPAPPQAHLERLRRLLDLELGWVLDEPASLPVRRALEGLGRELPPDLDLSFDELRLVLTRKLEDAGRNPLGGAGGGVQVLSVVEARARTFSHLFVVGAHRGSFPRNVRTDPLLPDTLRGALSVVLPDVPRKKSGFDEERYLFAQLLSAAPHVTLSWQSHDDEGQPLAPSPLVERLTRPAGGAGGDGAPEVPVAPAVYSTVGAEAASPTSSGRGPRPAREMAVVAALDGVSRTAFGGLFAVACGESRRTTGAAMTATPAGTAPDQPSAASADGLHTSPVQRLATARLRILDEMAPDLRSEEGRARASSLGPYLGFLGPSDRGDETARDPRLSAPWVTHVENLAACPWQTFLRKVLRLEPTPDPLQALPGADPLLLGSVVHEVLEKVVERSGAPVRPELADALRGAPVEPAWPGPDELDRWLVDAAREVLRRDGVPLEGLARALADRARPLVLRARELESGDTTAGGGAVGALGAEVAGEVTVHDADGAPRALRFLADRVDAAPSPATNTLRLTDYKTGRPLSKGKRQSTRDRKHLAEVESGRRLQAVAYRLAALALAGASPDVEASPNVEGRYLFLDPEIEEREMAEFSVGGGDTEMTAAFHDAVTTLLAAWDTGAFFPRVVDPVSEAEPTRCQYCEVSEACVRGDSGARLRLLRWNRERAGTATTAAEGAHNRVWWLAASPEQREEARRAAEDEAGAGEDGANEGAGDGGDGKPRPAAGSRKSHSRRGGANGGDAA